jgi:hypothetical protein
MPRAHPSSRPACLPAAAPRDGRVRAGRHRAAMAAEEARAEAKLGVDLIELSKRHVSFLRAAHAAGLTLGRPSAESFRRYVELWLPLATRAPPGDSLVPPSDVAWLWHCHRLAPYRYARYCRQVFGKVVEPSPPFSLQHNDAGAGCLLPDDDDDAADAGAAARALWANTYPGEPFFLSDDDKKPASASSRVGTLAGFDVLASAERQATFLWQVSQPRFRMEEFLAEGVENYRRFVMLRRHAPEQTIVPTCERLPSLRRRATFFFPFARPPLMLAPWPLPACPISCMRRPDRPHVAHAHARITRAVHHRLPSLERQNAGSRRFTERSFRRLRPRARFQGDLCSLAAALRRRISGAGGDVSRRATARLSPCVTRISAYLLFVCLG